MGKALVDTHHFSRAVAYYKEAIKKTNDSELKLQLAELYMNLRDFEKGELLLLNELEDDKAINSEDVTHLRYKTRLLNLLAQIQEKSGNITYALKSLKDAMDNQNRLRKRFVVEQSGEFFNYNFKQVNWIANFTTSKSYHIVHKFYWLFFIQWYWRILLWEILKNFRQVIANNQILCVVCMFPDKIVNEGISIQNIEHN